MDGRAVLPQPQQPRRRTTCTSAREVLIAMIYGAAPDPSVAEADPSCDRTDKGVPTRRAKAGFLLRRKGIDEGSIEDLVAEDMDNVLRLFREFNNGTHGHAGRFTITQLSALRIRVESAIGFLHTLCVVEPRSQVPVGTADVASNTRQNVRFLAHGAV